MASESSKVIKVIKASFLSGHLGILPNFHPSLHSWIETIDLGLPSEKDPKIPPNFGKSCLIWMVLTFLEMGAESGSNCPIKVIKSPHFDLALEDNRSLDIP